MRKSEGPFDVSLLGRQLRGIATELAVAIVVSALMALLVSLAGAAMIAPSEPVFHPSTILPIVDEDPQDLDPRDPLVLCTVFLERVSCAREES